MLLLPDVDAQQDRLFRLHIGPCAICHGTGWLHKLDDDFKMDRRRCACREEYDYQIGIRLGNVPPEFWAVERMPITHNVENFALIKGYCADLEGARKRGAGITMYGENGAGKTAMGTYILAKALRAGFTASYITAQDYITGIPRCWREPEMRQWMDELVDADFMLLDELGKEYRASEDSKRADIDTLLRGRRGAMKPTMIITNYSVSDFKAAYGESIVSILSDRNKNMVFIPGDYRKGRNGA